MLDIPQAMRAERGSKRGPRWFKRPAGKCLDFMRLFWLGDEYGLAMIFHLCCGVGESLLFWQFLEYVRRSMSKDIYHNIIKFQSGIIFRKERFVLDSMANFDLDSRVGQNPLKYKIIEKSI